MALPDQVRPTTAQTVYRADWVGTVLEESDRPLVARAYKLGEIIEGDPAKQEAARRELNAFKKSPDGRTGPAESR